MRNIIRVYPALIMIVFLAGCSTVSSTGKKMAEWAGLRLEHKVFRMEPFWVRPTLKDEPLSFRRLHRMTTIVGPELVYQGNSFDGLVAFERGSGSERWRLKVKNGVEGGGLLQGDRLYFGAGDGIFYCVNARDGKVVWTFNVNAETLSAPTYEAGMIYFQSGTDILYALDANTGRMAWLYNRQVSNNLSIRATTTPVVIGERVLAGFSDGSLVAIKKKEGSVVWEKRLGKGNRFRDVDSTPVVEGNTIYVASFDGALFSLNLENGDINWQLDEGGYVPVTLGRDRMSDRLYYSTVANLNSGGKILVVDKKTGKVMQTLSLKSGIATQPVLTKSYLIYGESDGALVVLDPVNLSTIGRFEPGRGIFSKPAVIENQNEVYFISNNANLFALRIGYVPTSHRLPWQEASR